MRNLINNKDMEDKGKGLYLLTTQEPHRERGEIETHLLTGGEIKRKEI